MPSSSKFSGMRKARLAARDVMLSEFQKIIDQTIVPTLASKINVHHKLLYGNGKPGLILELGLFKQEVKDQFSALTLTISGESGLLSRLMKIENWQNEITEWKNAIIWKVAAICGFCSGIGAVLGIVLDRVGVLKHFLGGS